MTQFAQSFQFGVNQGADAVGDALRRDFAERQAQFQQAAEYAQIKRQYARDEAEQVHWAAVEGEAVRNHNLVLQQAADALAVRQQQLAAKQQQEQAQQQALAGFVQNQQGMGPADPSGQNPYGGLPANVLGQMATEGVKQQNKLSLQSIEEEAKQTRLRKLNEDYQGLSGAIAKAHPDDPTLQDARHKLDIIKGAILKEEYGVPMSTAMAPVWRDGAAARAESRGKASAANAADKEVASAFDDAFGMATPVVPGPNDAPEAVANKQTAKKIGLQGKYAKLESAITRHYRAAGIKASAGFSEAEDFVVRGEQAGHFNPAEHDANVLSMVMQRYKMNLSGQLGGQAAPQQYPQDQADEIQITPEQEDAIRALMLDGMSYDEAEAKILGNTP